MQVSKTHVSHVDASTSTSLVCLLGCTVCLERKDLLCKLAAMKQSGRGDANVHVPSHIQLRYEEKSWVMKPPHAPTLPLANRHPLSSTFADSSNPTFPLNNQHPSIPSPSLASKHELSTQIIKSCLMPTQVVIVQAR